MRNPKRVFIILDPLDGPHIFQSAKAAWRCYRSWAKEAKHRSYDSFWDMSEPLEFTYRGVATSTEA
jgi:hypothetical protein